MFRLTKSLGLSLLVLSLGTTSGCGGSGGNEDEFAKYPGTTPPGTQANSEEAAPQAQRAAPKAP
ncbi:hypothetical protein SAMN05444166_3633 [Singulisphaera sp. GP187]|uniref:hypothetical protein n=1 Tax=Singulisphaera sp. GP187 TaxID=1882752 RepID=UPI00092BBF71|nr:hypothetical protein [Singulisphaera sp. GP187]SIO30460.1 hypothetical protein SAMN05444166_3633 [Singulisphaera sp. GP187]